MVYSELLRGRVCDRFVRWPGIVEKKMFGGVGFLLKGNMLVGIWHDSLIVRLGPELDIAALREAHVRPFDITGRPMRGWVLVEPAGIERDAQLADWIERAARFVRTLPAK